MSQSSVTHKAIEDLRTRILRETLELCRMPNEGEEREHQRALVKTLEEHLAAKKQEQQQEEANE